MSEKCPLCSSHALLFFNSKQQYYRCSCCSGIFVQQSDLLDKVSEKEVYQQHNIDVFDEGYRRFVSPITDGVKTFFTQTSRGLDFGSGRSEIISTVLGDDGYKIINYDPLFCNNLEALDLKYDFITSCEVIEHFFHPAKEFKKLSDMLHKHGKLFLMTELYKEEEFGSWYYKNDPTHVFFYTKKTFEYIKEKFGFESVKIKGRLVVLGKTS